MSSSAYIIARSPSYCVILSPFALLRAGSGEKSRHAQGRLRDVAISWRWGDFCTPMSTQYLWQSTRNFPF